MFDPNAVEVEVGTLQTVSPDPLKVKVRLFVIRFQEPEEPVNETVFPLTTLFVRVLLAPVLVKVHAPVKLRL